MWSFVIDPIDPDVIYLGSLYASCNSQTCPNPANLYKSQNGGVDWDPIFSDEINQHASGSAQEVSMDPTDHRHLVVTIHANCTAPFTANCQAESTDAGATWRMMNGPPSLKGWAEGAAPVVFGPTTWMIKTPQNGAYYTSDSGANFTMLSVSGINQLYRAASGTYYAATDYGLWRGPDVQTWSKVATGPVSNAIIDDGQRLFTGIRFPWQADPDKHFLSALQSDGNTWTVLASPNVNTVQGLGGPTNFAYDSDHHLLYVSMATDGMWRMVTQ